MNLFNDLLDILKALFQGIKEGLYDLVHWSKPPREAPPQHEDTSWKKYYKYPEWRSWAVQEVTAQIVVVLVLLILIREGVGEFRFIPSESMVPTMKIGDKLFVEKFSKIFRKQYNRSDIIIFYPPIEATDGKDVLHYDPLSIFARLTGLPFLPQPEAYIKRIVAIPGDKVQIRKNEGVFINGRHQEEPYHYGSMNFLPEYDTDELEIPEGYYYVLGDNRNYSFDSHYWGLLPKNRVIGRAAFLIYRSLSEKPSVKSVVNE
jgi:signal peptidase I